MITLLIIITNLVTIMALGELTAVVNTTSGPMRGIIVASAVHSVEYAAFKGIKYGKPPVGYQRFQPPIPEDPWTEIRNATVEGAPCNQIHRGRVIGSEDCLFLNVYTPLTNLTEIPSKPLATMICFHGGAWLIGSSSTEMYGPDFLVEKNVIVVTFNYRLGAFGFLNLDHPNATGNAGLKDQRLVLKWVQANIEKFGGNPNNVTAIGGSAGGMSVGFHLLSEGSVGLFHGLVSVSGAPLIPWAFQHPVESVRKAQDLVRVLGSNITDKSSLLAFLNAASVESIILGTAKILEIVGPFRPTLENVNFAKDIVISECSMLKYYTGNFTKIPQVMGYMDDEAVTYSACRKADSAAYQDAVAYLMRLVDYLGMEMPPCLPMALETIHWWRENFTDFERSLIVPTEKIMSDFLFISQVDMYQRILAAYNDNPVYYFHISFDMERSPHNIMTECHIPGAAHGDDLAYLWHARAANYSLGPDQPMGRTIHRLTTLFSNFAKYGHPTPDWIDDDPWPLGITWPDSRLKGDCLNVGDELKMEPRPMDEDRRNFQSYYWVRLPQIQGCL